MFRKSRKKVWFGIYRKESLVLNIISRRKVWFEISRRKVWFGVSRRKVWFGISRRKVWFGIWKTFNRESV